MFDKTRPYMEIRGIPGATYEQNGKMYNPGGLEVIVRVVNGKKESRATPVQAAVSAPAVAVPPLPAAAPPPKKKKRTPLHDMTDDELQELVEATGGEFSDRDAAVEFLSEAH